MPWQGQTGLKEKGGKRTDREIFVSQLSCLRFSGSDRREGLVLRRGSGRRQVFRHLDLRVVKTVWYGSTSHPANQPRLRPRPGSSRLFLKLAGEGACLSQGQRASAPAGGIQEGIIQQGLQPTVSSVSLPVQNEERLGTCAGDTLPEAFLLQ